MPLFWGNQIVWKSLIAIAGVTTVASVAGAVNHAQQPPKKVDFATEVLPILRQNCVTCHGPKEQKNGFRLDWRKDALRGGTIAMIGPGNADGSRLYQKLIGSHFGPQMPPTGALPAIADRHDQGVDRPGRGLAGCPRERSSPRLSPILRRPR